MRCILDRNRTSRSGRGLAAASVADPAGRWIGSRRGDAKAVDTDLSQKIQEAASLLVKRGATAVFLFGSAASGSLRDDSDIDLAVTGLPPEIFFRAMAEASRIVGRPVDLVSLDRADEVAESLRRSGELHRVA